MESPENGYKLSKVRCHAQELNKLSRPVTKQDISVQWSSFLTASPQNLLEPNLINDLSICVCPSSQAKFARELQGSNMAEIKGGCSSNSQENICHLQLRGTL